MAKKTEGMYQLNSFFAGIGGFDLGFERAGISPAFHCEISEYCNRVLNHHWPNAVSCKDIVSIKPSDIPDADVWCGGFPCQDVSVARGWLGRDGLKGKNSGLFYPFYHLISEKKPRVVILENVTGLLSSHEGQDFRVIIESLTGAGYGVAWRVLNTRYFGAPQSRPRVYICAWKGSVRSALRVLYESEAAPSPPNARKGFITSTRSRKSGAYVPLVAYCLAATSGRHTGTDWSRSYVSYDERVRRLTPTECEGLQGFPKKWTLPQNGDFGSKDEVDSLRYHALGNAVSVPVVEWVANRIVSELDMASTSSSNVAENCLVEIEDAFPHFRKENITRISKQASAIEKIKWGTGGCACGDFVIDAPVSPAPLQPIESKFIDVVEKGAVDEKYFLSPNAAEGIIRRVTSQNRTLFQPLFDALVKLSKSTEVKSVAV